MKKMTKIQFEKEQLDAINARKGHFLVSASAGSGKTSVLGQRATNIILEGTPVKRLLILTFAKKAAGEMAERIKKNLIENGRLDLANEIDLANIQTFDAFSLVIVKKYHNYLGIDSDVNVLDTTVAEVLRKRYLDEIFNPFFRIEKSRSRKTGGSGLGLYLVSKILKSHGYYYNLKNKENSVVFTIEFKS